MELETLFPNQGKTFFYNLSGLDKVEKMTELVNNYKYCKETYYYYISDEVCYDKPNNYWSDEGKKPNSLITKLAKESVKLYLKDQNEINTIFEQNIGTFNTVINNRKTSDQVRNQYEKARKEFSDQMITFNEKYKKYLNTFGSSAHAKTLIEFFTDKITDNDFINKCNFDNCHLLPLRNMNLDLKTLDLEARTQPQYFTKIVNIDERLFRYYKSAKDSIYNTIDISVFNKNFDKVDNFFLQIANGNKDKKNYLKQMLGYFITGEVKTRSFFIWYGDGSNGKSAVMNLIKVILGDYYKATNPGLIISKGQDSKASDASPQMECLDYGSRLCVLSETKKKDKLNEDVIKNITGGDVISYRPLYGGEKNIKSEAKLVLLTNNKPTFNMTKPMLKRLRYFLFSASFSEVPKDKEYLANPDLCDELLTSLIDYVLLWIAEGAEEYYNNDCKLDVPECMVTENESLLSDMDTYKLYKSNELVKTDNKRDKIVQSVAYAKYIEVLSGKGAVLDKFEFYDMMEHDFGKTHRIGGREYYINVKFNEGADDDDDEENPLDAI